MRRLLAAAAFAAALVPAGFAMAEPVAIAPVVIAPELQTKFEEDFGVREVEYLQNNVTRLVAQALERQGADVAANAPLTIEITILDADPNKPTFQQLGDTPGLDYFSSISLGGAEFSAVFRRADGTAVTDVTYRRFTPVLDEVNAAGGPWSEANRAARTFATRVARAYVGQLAEITSE